MVVVVVGVAVAGHWALVGKIGGGGPKTRRRIERVRGRRDGAAVSSRTGEVRGARAQPCARPAETNKVPVPISDACHYLAWPAWVPRYLTALPRTVLGSLTPQIPHATSTKKISPSHQQSQSPT